MKTDEKHSKTDENKLKIKVLHQQHESPNDKWR